MTLRINLLGAGIFLATGTKNIAQRALKTTPPCWVIALMMSLGTIGRASAASVIQFTASTFIYPESADAAIIIVQRTGDLNATATVDYATSDGTAANGVKYTASSGTLNFGLGETNKLIAVPILNNGFVEGAKTFQIALSNPSSGSILGARTTTRVSVTDNDAGIQFQFAAYSVAEDAGAVMLAIVRDDDGNLPVTVEFSTADLTATNRLDYTGVTNTLSFAPQERLKTVSIAILTNSLSQSNRTFRVNLANPVETSLGNQKAAEVEISKINQGFQFASSSYSVAQEAGVVRLAVKRGTASTNSAATVDFATTDVTARNGVDYAGRTNTLVFASGDTLQFVAIPLLNNGMKAPAKTFQAALSNPTGGAILAPLTSLNVTILNGNPGVGFEAASYTNAWSSETNVSLIVLRGNNAALGPITVDYSTVDLTAKAGTDYRPVAGTLQFRENETIKNLAIPILHPRASVGSKVFRVNLSNLTGGAPLATASTRVNIVGAYATVASPFDTSLSIERQGDANLIVWSGGGQLQRADSPLGPWQKLTNASSPYAVQSSIPTSFYRVNLPRPAYVYIPSRYDGQNALPLVLLLHTYGTSGAFEEDYLRIGPQAESRGFLYSSPDSTPDRWGKPFWNATDACCDFGNSGVDDSGYLRSLIEEIASHFVVDRKRVYLIGASNGAFMAYRMACEHADLIAGIATLAGVSFLDPDRCKPANPVSILHIQGTVDDIAGYGGGAITTINPSVSFPSNLPQLPGALQNIQLWARDNGASNPITDPTPTLDLTPDVPGLDTLITRYSEGRAGGAVELWTIRGGNHLPTLASQFSGLVIDWLLSHPKP